MIGIIPPKSSGYRGLGRRGRARCAALLGAMRVRPAGAAVVLVFLVAWGLAGCEAPQRPDAAAPPAPPASAAPTASTVWCSGGLLCEADTTLVGWRVPLACAAADIRSRVAVCLIAGVERVRLTEFFDSRYGPAAIEGGALRWTQSAAMAENYGVGGVAPTLRLMPFSHGWRVVATPLGQPGLTAPPAGLH